MNKFYLKEQNFHTDFPITSWHLQNKNKLENFPTTASLQLGKGNQDFVILITTQSI